jgi:hypothetical protein
MLKVRIYNTDQEVIAEGTCSGSGFFPPVVARIYNDSLGLRPLRVLVSCDTSSDLGPYPEGARRARFGYSVAGEDGDDHILDDEVILHIEQA